MLGISCGLRPDGLRALAAHKYVSGTYSPLDNALNAWWTAASTCFPLWMAPNLITLVGTLGMASTILMSAVTAQPIGTGSLKEEVPGWVHIYIAGMLFAYQTLDAVDGKQARRTKSSTPLGQLFDHGCDALTTSMILYNLALALGLGQSWPAVLLMGSVLTVFYAAQWEESTTHVLRTNVGGLGVTEAQVLLMVVHLCAAFLPRTFWSTSVASLLGMKASTALPGLDTPFNAVIAYTAAGIVSYAVLQFVFTVVVRGGHWRALTSLLPSTTLLVSLILAFSPWTTTLFWVPQLHPRLLLGLYALLQTFVTTKTIVYSMAHQALPAVEPASLLLPAVLFIDAQSLGAYGTPLLFAAAAVTLVVYLSFVASACNTICAHLHIHVFRIKRPEPEGNAAPIPSASSSRSTGGSHKASSAGTPSGSSSAGGRK